MSATATRRELDAIGRRRKKLRKLEDELARDTKTAISHARRDKVPMTEAADRVGLERTTIYQVYDDAKATSQPSSNGSKPARSSGGSRRRNGDSGRSAGATGRGSAIAA